MYVVLQLAEFEVESVGFPFLPVEVDAGKSCGYLPVYKTKKAALSEYPKAKLLKIGLAPKEEGK